MNSRLQKKTWHSVELPTICFCFRRIGIMTIGKFYLSLKAIAKRLVLLVSVIVLLGFSQTAALASSTLPETESTPNALIALAASSRFAAQAEYKDAEPFVSEDRLDDMKEKRREWQSKVSAAADNEKESVDSVEDIVKDKLNLNEITEENEIVKELKKP
jgi:hypothetical protein